MKIFLAIVLFFGATCWAGTTLPTSRYYDENKGFVIIELVDRPYRFFERFGYRDKVLDECLVVIDEGRRGHFTQLSDMSPQEVEFLGDATTKSVFNEESQQDHFLVSVNECGPELSGLVKETLDQVIEDGNHLPKKTLAQSWNNFWFNVTVRLMGSFGFQLKPC